MTTITKETYDVLDAAFDYFNTHLWEGALPPCAVTLQRKKGAYGYHATGHMFNRKGEPVAEIALNPDTFKDRTLREVLSTLVHEMAHLWQWRYGEPSRNGYHNKEWANEMERIGLMPTDTGKEGGKRTGQKVSHYIVEGGDFDRLCSAFLAEHKAELKFYSKNATTSQQTKAKRKSKTKYTCACGQNVWGKPDLDIFCGDCGEPFIPEYEGEDDDAE